MTTRFGDESELFIEILQVNRDW